MLRQAVAKLHLSQNVEYENISLYPSVIACDSYDCAVKFAINK